MTTTAVDVRWQDGRQEARVPARDLVPVAHLDEHDFFVGNLVEETTRSPTWTPMTRRRGCLWAEPCLRSRHVAGMRRRTGRHG